MNQNHPYSRLIVENAHWDAGRAAADKMDFLRDVAEGLSCNPKSLPSRHLYDAEGSRIFEEIMGLAVYYPVRCEEEILRANKRAILEAMGSKPFHVVDLGAGNGSKSRILLEYFHRAGALLSYVPVDISGDALDRLSDSLRASIPGLPVQPLADEYFPALDRLEAAAMGPKLVLFLGSTIGNFSLGEAVSFLKSVRASLSPGDGLLIGFDLCKDPAKILKAYDDDTGVTARFNLNLLARINRELQGDFRLEGFHHHAVYDPVEKVARSYLVSARRQIVRLGAAGLAFSFDPWEAIHTENSFKYLSEETRGIAEAAGFREKAVFPDPAGYFLDAFWVRTG